MLELLLRNSDKLAQYTFYFLTLISVRFIFSAVGIFLVAKKKIVKNPGIAFIPFVSPFVLGKVSDKINLRNGNKTKNAKTLLLLSIFKTVAFFGFLAATYFSFNAIVLNAAEAIKQDVAMTPQMFSSVIFVVAIFVVAFILSLFYAIYYYISLFKVYKSEMYLGFAIVGLIISIIAPFGKELILLIVGLIAKEDIGFEIE